LGSLEEERTWNNGIFHALGTFDENLLQIFSKIILKLLGKGKSIRTKMNLLEFAMHKTNFQISIILNKKFTQKCFSGRSHRHIHLCCPSLLFPLLLVTIKILVPLPQPVPLLTTTPLLRNPTTSKPKPSSYFTNGEGYPMIGLHNSSVHFC
jgi:hypothetical protein